MEFREALELVIKHVLKRFYKPNTVCEVVSVNTENNTCKLKETGTGYEIAEARLLSVVDDFDAKFVVYPKVGSLVTIAYLFSSSDKCVIIKYSEVETIHLNGSGFGGLVKADVLKEELDKTNEAVNAIMDAINNSAFAAGDGGATLQTNMKVYLVGKTVGDFTGIKNDKVKHGN